jgi:anti-anti-sigma factor
MDIIESKDSHGTTLKITRSLDRTNCSDLAKALARLLKASEEPIWLDVSELQSVDSAGLTLFLQWHRRCLAKNRRFAVVRTASFHRKLLEITQLDEELVIFDEPGGVRITMFRPGPWKTGEFPSLGELP